MKNNIKKLSPTSYVLLGLLARKPWSAYELNSHMQSSILSAFWPRAESHVYSEPKKLLAMELVSAEKQDNNGRQRTVYSITAEGENVLEQWLSTPSDGYASIHYEAMLQFLCADSSSVENLRSNLEGIRQGALNEARLIREGIDRVAKLVPTSIRGMPFNAMTINFLLDVVEARLQWVDDTEAALQQLPDTQDEKYCRELGADAYQQAVTRLDEILAR